VVVAGPAVGMVKARAASMLALPEPKPLPMVKVAKSKVADWPWFSERLLNGVSIDALSGQLPKMQCVGLLVTLTNELVLSNTKSSVAALAAEAPNRATAAAAAII